MKSRSISIYLAVVVIVCATGVGGYAFWRSDHGATVTTGPHHNPALLAASHRLAESAPSLIRLLPSLSNLDLNWSPMKDLAAPQRAHHYANVTITRASVPPPLNLELPANVPRNANPRGRDALSKGSTIRSDHRPASVEPLVLNVNPNIDDHGAEFADDAKLFNRSNGLRGFMAQNWLNKNVGLQGGVAIKENRLRDEDSNLRDNMAVGMGVLLAF